MSATKDTRFEGVAAGASQGLRLQSAQRFQTRTAMSQAHPSQFALL